MIDEQNNCVTSVKILPDLISLLTETAPKN